MKPRYKKVGIAFVENSDSAGRMQHLGQLQREVELLRLRETQSREQKCEAAKSRALLADVFYALSEPNAA